MENHHPRPTNRSWGFLMRSIFHTFGKIEFFSNLLGIIIILMGLLRPRLVDVVVGESCSAPVYEKLICTSSRRPQCNTAGCADPNAAGASPSVVGDFLVRNGNRQ